MATITVKEVREFKDLDLNFLIHPIKKDINVLTGDRAVINSVKNLILTNLYEKPFLPEFGSNVRKLLFENLDPVTATMLQREIEEVLRTFEPRVRVSVVTVVPNYDANAFSVTIQFFILNSTRPINVNFLLGRIR